MSVAVTQGDHFRAGTPVALFQLSVPPLSLPYRSRFAVTRDGQRVLAISGGEAKTSIQVLLNWRRHQKTE
jgi:hypothetical protein